MQEYDIVVCHFHTQGRLDKLDTQAEFSRLIVYECHHIVAKEGPLSKQILHLKYHFAFLLSNIHVGGGRLEIWPQMLLLPGVPFTNFEHFLTIFSPAQYGKHGRNLTSETPPAAQAKIFEQIMKMMVVAAPTALLRKQMSKPNTRYIPTSIDRWNDDNQALLAGRFASGREA